MATSTATETVIATDDTHAGDQRDADQGEAEHRDHHGDAGEDHRPPRGVDGETDRLRRVDDRTARCWRWRVTTNRA